MIILLLPSIEAVILDSFFYYLQGQQDNYIHLKRNKTKTTSPLFQSLESAYTFLFTQIKYAAFLLVHIDLIHEWHLF